MTSIGKQITEKLLENLEKLVLLTTYISLKT